MKEVLPGRNMKDRPYLGTTFIGSIVSRKIFVFDSFSFVSLSGCFGEVPLCIL